MISLSSSKIPASFFFISLKKIWFFNWKPKIIQPDFIVQRESKLGKKIIKLKFAFDLYLNKNGSYRIFKRSITKSDPHTNLKLRYVKKFIL